MTRDAKDLDVTAEALLSSGAFDDHGKAYHFLYYHLAMAEGLGTEGAIEVGESALATAIEVEHTDAIGPLQTAIERLRQMQK